MPTLRPGQNSDVDQPLLCCVAAVCARNSWPGDPKRAGPNPAPRPGPCVVGSLVHRRRGDDGAVVAAGTARHVAVIE